MRANELEKLFAELKNTSFDLFQFEGEMFDVAFDIKSADSYIAGITDSLIKNYKINESDLVGLKISFLVDEHYWLFEGVKKVDLKPYPDVLKLALVIEELRIKCLKAFKNKGN